MGPHPKCAPHHQQKTRLPVLGLFDRLALKMMGFDSGCGFGSVLCETHLARLKSVLGYDNLMNHPTSWVRVMEAERGGRGEGQSNCSITPTCVYSVMKYVQFTHEHLGTNAHAVSEEATPSCQKPSEVAHATTPMAGAGIQLTMIQSFALHSSPSLAHWLTHYIASGPLYSIPTFPLQFIPSVWLNIP